MDILNENYFEILYIAGKNNAAAYFLSWKPRIFGSGKKPEHYFLCPILGTIQQEHLYFEPISNVFKGDLIGS